MAKKDHKCRPLHKNKYQLYRHRDKMVRPCSQDGTEFIHKNCSEVDTIWEKKKRTTENHLVTNCRG